MVKIKIKKHLDYIRNYGGLLIDRLSTDEYCLRINDCFIKPNELAILLKYDFN